MTNKRESRIALDHQIHRRHLKAKIVVTGNDADIKREFERIERNQTIADALHRLDLLIDTVDILEDLERLEAKQAKSPSAGTDGL